MQKEGQKRLIGLQGQKPCKKLGGKRQNIDGGAFSQVGEREKLKFFFEKVTLKSPIWLFKKNMFHEFQSIEKQPRSIEKQPRSIKTDTDSIKTI